MTTQQGQVKRNKWPIISLLSSVIIGAIGVLGYATFVPYKNGQDIPVWQAILWFFSIAAITAGILGFLISLVWWVLSLVRKSN